MASWAEMVIKYRGPIVLFALIVGAWTSDSCNGQSIHVDDLPEPVDGLSWTFYNCSCPNLESIVTLTLNSVLDKDITQAATLLHLHFHDCFIQVGITSTLQNLASGKNTNKRLQFDEFEGFILMGRGIIDGHGEKSWAGQCKWVNRQGFVRTWNAACKKSSAILLVPTNKIFGVNNLLLEGPCQPNFILKIDGIIAAPQNAASGKSTNKWLQFPKESFLLMGKDIINGHGEKWWARQCRRVNKQRKLPKRLLLERAKPNKGGDPHHH